MTSRSLLMSSANAQFGGPFNNSGTVGLVAVNDWGQRLAPEFQRQSSAIAAQDGLHDESLASDAGAHRGDRGSHHPGEQGAHDIIVFSPGAHVEGPRFHNVKERAKM